MACVYWIRKHEHIDMFSEGYIGFTAQNAHDRYRGHVRLMKEGTLSTRLYETMRKYGHKNLVVETLVKGTNDYCLDLEKKLRPLPNIGWNVAIGGEAPMLGYKWSEETRKKFIKSRTGISTKKKGQIQSEETKKKISAAHMGRPKKKMSDETKEKIRQVVLDHWKNNPQNKIGAGERARKYLNRTGKTHSKEVRKKISLSHIGRKIPEEIKQKMKNSQRLRREREALNK